MESSPSTKYPFSETYIGQAPDDAGVYWLWRGPDLIYVGMTADGTTIRSRLRDHFYGRSCACSSEATHYLWHLAQRPAERRAQILKALELTDRMPPCNRHAENRADKPSPSRT